MRTLVLLIVGFLLLVNNMVVLGAISLAVALLAKRDGEQFWSLILGIILLFSPSWMIAGIICIVCAFFKD